MKKGDENLEAERGYQLDVGFNWQKKRWLAKLSPFFNYFHNFIYLAPTGRFTTLPRSSGQVHQYRQAEALHSGSELTIDYHVLNNLHLGMIADVVLGHNLEEDRPLPQTPPATLRFDAEYEYTLDGKVLREFFVAASTRLVSKQTRTERNEFETPGYHLIDLSIGGELFSEDYPWKVLVHVRNLTDNDYFNHLSRFRLLNLPEPGRNVVVTLRIPLLNVAPKRHQHE